MVMKRCHMEIIVTICIFVLTALLVIAQTMSFRLAGVSILDHVPIQGSGYSGVTRVQYTFGG